MKKLLDIWIMIITVVIMAAMNVYSQKEDGMKESVILREVKTFEGPYVGHFSPDGTKLALRDDEKVWIVEIKTGKMLCEFKPSLEGTGSMFDLAFTRNWERFAISFFTRDRSGKKPYWEEPYKIKVILVEATTCKEIKTLYHNEIKDRDTRLGLSFFGGGKKLALVSGFLRIVDVESGEEEMVYEMDSFPEGYEPMKNLLSSDGRWLVFYAGHHVSPKFFSVLYVIDLESGERKLLSKDEQINKIKFSRDEQLLAANSFVKNYGKKGIGYERVKTKVYEVGSWKLLRTFEESGEVFDISPDNKLLATGQHWGKKEGTVNIYSLETGEKLEEKYHYKRTFWDDLVDASAALTMIHHVEFSADGKMLASGGFDSRVKLWKVERVKEKKKKRSWWRKIFRDNR